MKTIFATFATSDLWMEYCAIPLRRSLKYFHPDAEFHIFDISDIDACKALDPTLCITNLKPTLGYILANKGYDRIILLDADQIVVAPLPELLDENWVLAGVRNNNDLNGAGMGSSFGYLFDGTTIPFELYLNAGLIGITGKDMWAAFKSCVLEHSNKKEEGEQNVWNYFFYKCGHKGLLLDPINQSYYYGTASAWGTKTSWDSWKTAYMKNNQIRVVIGGKDKQIKLLHKSGGCSAPQGVTIEKYVKGMFYESLEILFPVEVANFIRKIAYD